MQGNLEKEESADARETSEQYQGKCRDGESSQENTKQSFQLEFDCETEQPRKSSHRLLPDLHSVPADQEDVTNPRDSTGRTLEKPENGLRGWNADFTKETGESTEQTEKREGSPDQITADVLKALP